MLPNIEIGKMEGGTFKIYWNAKNYYKLLLIWEKD